MKRMLLSDGEPKGSSCKAAKPADKTGLSPQRSHCFPQSSMLSLPCPSSLRAALPMAGPLLLALGADAVWVGTRLLASFEAYTHPQYKERVVAAGVEDTARHMIFGPEFPDASTRGLRDRIVREWKRHDDPPPCRVIPASELSVIGQARIYGQEFPMTRFCGFPPTPEFTGDFEEMSMLAGESVGQTKRLTAAAEIIDEMIGDAESVIKKRLGSMVVN
jgi:nitronate monooxygenase